MKDRLRVRARHEVKERKKECRKAKIARETVGGEGWRIIKGKG